jgi:hypothetical protein
LADVMFIRTLAAVAIVPVKAGDLVKVDHVYMLNIYKMRNRCNIASCSGT